MNHNFAPWDNPAVRQAIAIGIDRQRIVDNFLPPGSEVATHFTPCSIPFACEGDAWPDYDVDAARAAITEIFGEAGLTTTLSYRPPARGYVPLPAETASRLPGAARAHQRPRRRLTSRSQRPTSPTRTGQAGRPVPARLGCRLSGRHQLPRLPLRRWLHGRFRHVLPGDRRSADHRRPDRGRGGSHGGLHGGQQRPSGSRFRWSRSHTLASRMRISRTFRTSRSRRSAMSCCSG